MSLKLSQWKKMAIENREMTPELQELIDQSSIALKPERVSLLTDSTIKLPELKYFTTFSNGSLPSLPSIYNRNSPRLEGIF